MAEEQSQLIIADHYDSILRDIDIFTENRLKEEEGDTSKCEELNTIREEFIKATRQAEKETFEFYETTISKELKSDEILKSLRQDEKINYLKNKLFSRIFAVLFVCNIKSYGEKMVLGIIRDSQVLTEQIRIYLK